MLTAAVARPFGSDVVLLALAALALEDDDLLGLALFQHRALNLGPSNERLADLHLAVVLADEQHLIVLVGVPRLGLKAVHPNGFSGTHPKLVSAGANNCVHGLNCPVWVTNEQTFL